MIYSGTVRPAQTGERDVVPRKQKACLGKAGYWAHQNSLRLLLAAMRIRKALSLMNPAASAWL